MLHGKKKECVKQCRNDPKFDVEALGSILRPTICSDLRNTVFKIVVARTGFFCKNNATFAFKAKRCWNGLRFDVEPLGGILRPTMCSILGIRVSSTTVARTCFSVRRVKLG